MLSVMECGRSVITMTLLRLNYLVYSLGNRAMTLSETGLTNILKHELNACETVRETQKNKIKGGAAYLGRFLPPPPAPWAALAPQPRLAPHPGPLPCATSPWAARARQARPNLEPWAAHPLGARPPASRSSWTGHLAPPLWAVIRPAGVAGPHALLGPLTDLPS